MKLSKRSRDKMALASEETKAMKHQYFLAFGSMLGDDDYIAPCQYCGAWVKMSDCHFHHKIKRSQGGGNGTENRIALHPACHMKAHETKRILDAIRDSSANVINGEIIHADQRF